MSIGPMMLNWLTCAVNGAVLGLLLWRHDTVLVWMWGLVFVLSLVAAVLTTQNRRR